MEAETEPLMRDKPIEARRAALLVIDVQNWVFSDQARVTNAYFQQRLHERVLPNLRRLIDAARKAGAEVLYTVIENLTRDGRDRSLDYKLSNISVARGSWEAKVIDAVAPADDDIVLAKTSSSLFNSTNCDYLLRNLGIEHLVVTGLLTDQCVDHTIRDAADRGYRAICVEDACATLTAERHDAALSLFAGYCRILNTDAVIDELRGSRTTDV
jgi:Amidases related to nicotinamidase